MTITAEQIAGLRQALGKAGAQWRDANGDAVLSGRHHDLRVVGSIPHDGDRALVLSALAALPDLLDEIEALRNLVASTAYKVVMLPLSNRGWKLSLGIAEIIVDLECAKTRAALGDGS